MFFIASNITTRDKQVSCIFLEAKEAGWSASSEPARKLGEIAEQCASAGADGLEINIQQHYDHPEAMEFAVKAVQQVTGLQLCLSTNHAGALEAGLQACQRPPLVNYLSIDQSRLKDMLPAIARHGASVVLLVSEPSAPTDAREMLQKTAILAGAASEAGIPDERIFVDPGLIHITSDMGQRHLVQVMEFLRALPDAAEPPVKSICWLANSSAGAPRRLRPVIETSLLPMLAGAGLSSVFWDVLPRPNRRAIRLLRMFHNEMVYSHSELEL